MLEELPEVITAFSALVKGATQIVESFSAGKVTKDQALAALNAGHAERTANRAAEDDEIDNKFR